jgi:hypothetical protein
MRVFAGPLLATASGDWQFIMPSAIMLATSVVASLATAQTIPLTATKTRVTYEVRPSGAIVLTGALVMELADGETLSGQLPLDTALNCARNIVETLESHD